MFAMNQSTKGVIFTMAGGIFWGISGIIGKYLFDQKGLTAVWLVTLRLLSAGFLMLLFAAVQKRGKIFSVWKKKRMAASQMVFCLFGMTACQMSYFLAIQYSNPGTATVLQYIAPAIIMLFCLAVEKRRPKRLEVIVLFCVIAGVFLLATHGDPGSLTMTGQALFWGLFSAVALAIYNIQPEKLLDEFGSLETVGWGMFLGGILMVPVVGFWNVPGIWDSRTVLMALCVIIFGTVIPFGCYLEGVRLLGPVRASMFACVEPLVAAVMSVIFLGEIFGGMDILGFALILGGVTSLAVFDRN
jgi:drug/metabolite transporter (DMT)-like permease